MIYAVSHRTVYRYSRSVSVSHHLLHLTPRLTPYQDCRETAIELTPAPTVRASNVDYFGNPTTFVTVQHSHREFVLHASSTVEVRVRDAPDPRGGVAWEEVARDRSPEALEAAEFTFPSRYVPPSPELGAYAAASFPAGRDAREAAIDLTRRIYRDFRYDPRATTLATSVAEAFAMRRGVCQDFAHIQIACLRALGLPARYVSGYLLTRPPAGKERLVGADASHAWVSTWLPGHGWLDLDPTNDKVVGPEHVTLAWGRDYGDVSPVNGVMFGGGAHEVSVGVDVVPVG